MFVQPGIQVNPVIDAAPTEPDIGHIQLAQESDADPQIFGSLFLGQTPNRGQGEQRRDRVFHGSGPYSPREARR